MSTFSDRINDTKAETAQQIDRYWQDGCGAGELTVLKGIPVPCPYIDLPHGSNAIACLWWSRGFAYGLAKSMLGAAPQENADEG